MKLVKKGSQFDRECAKCISGMEDGTLPAHVRPPGCALDLSCQENDMVYFVKLNGLIGSWYDECLLL